jgi:hypothetical protein
LAATHCRRKIASAAGVSRPQIVNLKNEFDQKRIQWVVYGIFIPKKKITKGKEE